MKNSLKEPYTGALKVNKRDSTEAGKVEKLL